ncbi:12343_t:CDS:2 [Cetraspora pellucida]|uniref:12343_t:CDS:1 n=1 Tax=Cetraspora pellucida TaxID=1433469 RepID=A0ACA9L4G8_9GLOM|nr:12343_t:CDS:2 [Cetraspora pellucida]
MRIGVEKVKRIGVEKAEQELSEQVKDKNGLEDELEDLIDSYLETLKTWTPKPDT